MPRQAKPWLRADRDAWYARIGGKQVRLCSAEEGHDEATKKFHSLMASEGRIPAAKLSVPQACNLFLRAIKKTHKPTTFDWYQGHLTSFCRRHRSLSVRALKPFHVTLWIEGHPSWGLSTQRGAITAVKRAFAWAHEEGYIASNPIAKSRRPKMGVRKPITEDDVEKITAAVKTNAMRELIVLLIETGARPGEISTVTTEQFDRGTGSLKVVGKSGERVVTLSPTAVELVAELADRRPVGPLLRSPRGVIWNRNNMRCAFRRLRQETGVKNAVAYSFRHLYGTRALANGVDSLLVAQLMGHRDVKMLRDHYAHPDPETLKKAAAKATKRDKG